MAAPVQSNIEDPLIWSRIDKQRVDVTTTVACARPFPQPSPKELASCIDLGSSVERKLLRHRFFITTALARLAMLQGFLREKFAHIAIGGDLLDPRRAQETVIGLFQVDPDRVKMAASKSKVPRAALIRTGQIPDRQELGASVAHHRCETERLRRRGGIGWSNSLNDTKPFCG